MLWLVATAAFMQMLDTTIVNTALPSMAVSLGESPLRMQAVVASYALAVAMLIPASGWLADRFGTRRVFVAAVVLFSAGSLACALSRGLMQLVASRVLQALGLWKRKAPNAFRFTGTCVTLFLLVYYSLWAIVIGYRFR